MVFLWTQWTIFTDGNYWIWIWNFNSKHSDFINMTLKEKFFYGLLKVYGKIWITNEQKQLKNFLIISKILKHRKILIPFLMKCVSLKSYMLLLIIWQTLDQKISTRCPETDRLPQDTMKLTSPQTSPDKKWEGLGKSVCKNHVWYQQNLAKNHPQFSETEKLFMVFVGKMTTVWSLKGYIEYYHHGKMNPSITMNK